MAEIYNAYERISSISFFFVCVPIAGTAALAITAIAEWFISMGKTVRVFDAHRVAYTDFPHNQFKLLLLLS